VGDPRGRGGRIIGNNMLFRRAVRVGIPPWPRQPSAPLGPPEARTPASKNEHGGNTDCDTQGEDSRAVSSTRTILSANRSHLHLT
jgi:hypothetical protein